MCENFQEDLAKEPVLCSKKRPSLAAPQATWNQAAVGWAGRGHTARAPTLNLALHQNHSRSAEFLEHGLPEHRLLEHRRLGPAPEFLRQWVLGEAEILRLEHVPRRYHSAGSGIRLWSGAWAAVCRFTLAGCKPFAILAAGHCALAGALSLSHAGSLRAAE